MFEDLELPNLVKRQLTGGEEFKYHRAGIANEGNPGKVNIVRSLRAANARRMALTGQKRKQLRACEEELAALVGEDDPLVAARRKELEQLITELKLRIKRVPWLDDFDLKYNLQVKHPVPSSKAVMFCVMDVSGSMDQATKDVAKRFFSCCIYFYSAAMAILRWYLFAITPALKKWMSRNFLQSRNRRHYCVERLAFDG